ncbi:branched-chain-amino-acid transaminase [Candidatus Kaiserbacteria bacterium RIFCSPHIGHO2_02_FULL_59_21]|uniref:Branched-chain-amino-acid aminotransferase n=2 Tax=Candidatus Kaiseribacteriota TaxID=1752734 RepID=A0A0G1YXC8_9BACT|nr:MAG: Branched-chain amino acid aminotransferase [Candidatus Kaiserbacteria bacterium GW2011_GWA2_58_9]OGG61601.1 MAG: branched-chain-amino-acid transaminase [Candidatus Kaiserbacteria bacterium RIFCSPHIGHO2_01_FULL_58_22]OGG66869.1 MAG: branched-chain-amino-acid transaminase [Candidatus Kaiserbacteria bacterium RIFCSPHIGHO2_02_FULL_59_21]OGG80756.1 MAG: branched-chain-amino-acid transaminase [Candidatus Kaiserbacteria bacterium RIFCSPLOWO2_01_FULL_59_34]OGG86231.1 MAG: branched-chain-amino-a
METTKYIWWNGKLVPWADAKTHVLTHTLHYGTGTFEGIRMYETKEGGAIFHLKKHMERLVFSAQSLGMQLPYSVDQLSAATVELVKANELRSCYIRPIIYYGFGEVRVMATNCPVEAAIAAWPWGAYLGHEPARVTIVKTIRIHPQTTVPGAKLTGNYINSMLAAREALDRGYTEGLLLDYQGNIAEGPGENFFIVNGKTISTPALGSILPGITRWSVMTLAKDLEYKVEERPIAPAEATVADEAFFTGTAAEVIPIASIDDKPMKSAPGPVTKHIRDEFLKITCGENPKYRDWLTFVK